MLSIHHFDRPINLRRSTSVIPIGMSGTHLPYYSKKFLFFAHGNVARPMRDAEVKAFPLPSGALRGCGSAARRISHARPTRIRGLKIPGSVGFCVPKRLDSGDPDTDICISKRKTFDPKMPPSSNTTLVFSEDSWLAHAPALIESLNCTHSVLSRRAICLCTQNEVLRARCIMATALLLILASCERLIYVILDAAWLRQLAIAVSRQGPPSYSCHVWTSGSGVDHRKYFVPWLRCPHLVCETCNYQLSRLR